MLRGNEAFELYSLALEDAKRHGGDTGVAPRGPRRPPRKRYVNNILCQLGEPQSPEDTIIDAIDARHGVRENDEERILVKLAGLGLQMKPLPDQEKQPRIIQTIN